MTFPELLAAGLMLLQQTNPGLADSRVTIRQSDAPYAGYIDLAQPEIVWINPEYAYNARLMRAVLAHEFTHYRDWQRGALSLQTCGEDYVQAEYRAFKAERDWLPLHDAVMLNYVRAQPYYQKPCRT